ncbi:hypothetical protein Ais01nite_74000 [Asanoa ishikariensis]|uniref:Uncharacterized protein n=1 Tax=Asanoa ishikariensis TaxID=137265 RepID=A0A1H3USU3_9ACTN|nr:hypothetical protein [Asanoa ishikariensis]GIF69365.1 hypothetical protein Ais01nite_74000 [Asanoa ishikariensis]SDZ65091.1 hypothetical protein SAMN05421684_7924 [Asanoa ishikariensis]
MTSQHATEEAMRTATPVMDTTERPDIVAIAWPTGRPIYPYTRQEIAEGVDVYTKAMKARTTSNPGGRHEG